MGVENPFTIFSSRHPSSDRMALTYATSRRAERTGLELSRHESPIQDFVRLPEVEASLDKHQRETLDYLVSAARRVADLYIQQESDWVRFYPKGVQRYEVQREAQVKPELLSPYTMVERDQEGGLIASHMHQAFGPAIKEKGIARRLRRAADEAGKGKNRDIQLQGYLRAKAHALETQDKSATQQIKAAEKIWLERQDEPTIDIVIGLYDTYTDKFKIKYSWQAWVGVLDRELTSDSQWFMDVFLTWWGQETGKDAPKVKMRVDHTVIMAGQAGRYKWVGNSLPCQPQWREEMGSKFTIFEPQFEDKFRYRKLPAFREFIDPDKIAGITDSWIRITDLRKYIAHETGHSLIPGENHQQRLGKDTSWLKELYCELLALYGYRESFKKIPSASLRESEIAMAMTLAQGYLDYEDRDKKEDYHTSSTILADLLIERDAVWIESGVYTWHETPIVFDAIGDSLSEVQNVLVDGRAKDAKDLKDRHFKPDIYKHLHSKQSYPFPSKETEDPGTAPQNQLQLPN